MSRPKSVWGGDTSRLRSVWGDESIPIKAILETLGTNSKSA